MTQSPHRVDSGQLVVKVSWGSLRAGVEHSSVPDLDLQALLFDNDGMVLDAVYYNKPRSNDAAVVHTSGDEAGDRSAPLMVYGEEIVVDIKSIDPMVQSIGFTLSSFLTTMPLTDVADVVITVEHQPSATPGSDDPGEGLYRTCFLQDQLGVASPPPPTTATAGGGAPITNGSCPPALVARVASLKRFQKHDFTVNADVAALAGKTFVDATPSLRRSLGLHYEPDGRPEFRLPLSLAKGEAMDVVPATGSDGVSESPAPSTMPVVQRQLVAAVRWDARAGAGGTSSGEDDDDVDLGLLVFDGHNRVVERVHWGHLSAFGGAIKHTGDNVTGSVSKMDPKHVLSGPDERDAAEDNESISIDLSKLPGHARRLVFFVNNYESPAALRAVQNLRFRLYVPGIPGQCDESTLVRIFGSALVAESSGYAMAMLATEANGGWKAVCMAEPVEGTSVLDVRVAEGLAGAVMRYLDNVVEPTNLRSAFCPTPGGMYGRQPDAESSRRPHQGTAVSNTSTKLKKETSVYAAAAAANGPHATGGQQQQQQQQAPWKSWAIMALLLAMLFAWKYDGGKGTTTSRKHSGRRRRA